MQDSSRPVTGYPVQYLNGCAPPPTASAPPPTAYARAYVNPNLRPYYRTPPPQDSRSIFINRCLHAAVAVVFTIICVLCIIYTVIRPQDPDFSMQSLSLSDFNVANQRVNATWNAEIQVWNPNKRYSISYREVVSSVSHKDYFLSETMTMPFVQGKRSAGAVAVAASYSMTDSFVDGYVVDEMNEEMRAGEMKFNVKVSAYVEFRYRGWTWSEWQRFLTAWCDGLVITASSGKMIGGPQRCI